MDKKISEAILERGYAIAVFDADVSSRNEVEKKKLESIRKKYAKKKNVILCDSMTSIEYWFLLHFENTNRHFKDAAATEQELKKHIPDYEKKVKFLQNIKWVSDMCADEKLETAINRAKAFDHSGKSYSDVYKAFELLDRIKWSIGTWCYLVNIPGYIGKQKTNTWYRIAYIDSNIHTDVLSIRLDFVLI